MATHSFGSRNPRAKIADHDKRIKDLEEQLARLALARAKDLEALAQANARIAELEAELAAEKQLRMEVSDSAATMVLLLKSAQAQRGLHDEAEARIAELEAQPTVLGEWLPDYYYEALAKWPWLPPRDDRTDDEWRNRTRVENACWLAGQANARITALEAGPATDAVEDPSDFRPQELTDFEARGPSPAPRYDAVFYEGTAALDALAHAPDEEPSK